MTDSPLAVPFPKPPQEVRRALEQLRLAEDAGLEPTGLPLLDRPWDPATCSPSVRQQLWPWLGDVAAWLNHTYAWQTTHAIPSCWARHPHLVQELAVLACLRITAAAALVPHALEEWHRYALPSFHARMSERLGTGCPPGRHTDWPARSRAIDYDSRQATEARRALFDDDLRRTPATESGAGPTGSGIDRP
ncbi:hypothetical protein SAMN06893096_106244 [Geodermatophilus pulveris]|uniref:DUF4913 domain-containing protein n=1 Tax=Geodermatophilus pulveris TaxID=1564159 RepID=A0A239GN27_9ACTN|nr:hypothetical protein [Geodermatophilus pulveris]SNS69474.1 hypothetical protein SAMN06893096_106244 [Geodermatophilus pulveris]